MKKKHIPGLKHKNIKRVCRICCYKPSIVAAVFRQEKLPPCVFEHVFHTPRKFSFDIAWPEYKVAVEAEGGIYIRGSHGSITGILRDIKKYNLATLDGWSVYRVQPKDLLMAETIQDIRMLLMMNGWVRNNGVTGVTTAGRNVP